MTNTPAVYTPQQLRHLSRIVKAEREVAAATVKALQLLGQAVRDQLTNDGYTATVLDSRAPVWREQLAEQIMPTIARVYDQGFRSQTRATTAAIMPSGEAVPGDFGMADHLATQYLQTVHNRMVGVADDVFAVIAATLEEGRQATYTLDDGTSVVGDSIPQLAARVQAVLADNTRWSGDATRVARTEVIGANNAGAHAAAYNNAELFGSSSTEVIKEWLDTADERTRESHRIGGQKVLGLDTPFSVGGASLQQPGDPSGPAGEVINCVVGSTQVAWPGQLVHATTRREYSGTFVHIVTARGHDLTVTPNHPVLTEDGYVPAQSLRVGQNVIATLRPPAPEVEDGPPSIEQVHAAAQQVGTTRGVRGSRVDFHGDGTEAEVEVVRPDRNLLLEGDVERIREGLQQVLVRLSDGARGFADSRRAKRRAKAVRIGDRERANSRAAGLVGSCSAGTALLWGHAGGRGKVGLAAGPDRQTQTLEAAQDQRTTDAEVTRHLEDTLALGMTPCQIIEVDVYEGTHDVFNLQTSDAWYVGNGIAQHNCRCTALYHYPGDPGYDEMAAELGAVPTPQQTPAIHESVGAPATDQYTAGLQKNAQVYADAQAKGSRSAAVRRWDRYQYAGQDGYSAQNTILRGADTKERRALVKSWDQTFDNLGMDTTEPAVLHRGLKGEPGTDWSVILGNPGDVFVDDGVVSTTASAVMARSWLSYMPRGAVDHAGSVLLEIRVPAGTRVVGGHEGTFETMLKPGTKFRVIGKGTRPSGKYIADQDYDPEGAEVKYVIVEVVP